MENKNGYWVDENKNYWDERYFTKEQAILSSKSLVDCANCTDCTDCIGCTDCTNCINCIGCTDCGGCTSCRGCSYCTDCTDCTDCSCCTGCTDCTNCIGCTDCTDCTDCRGLKSILSQPQIYTTSKIGSRGQQSTFIFTDGEIKVRCGCFWGTLHDFELAVEKKHGNNEYGIAYKKEIAKVKILFESEGE